MLFTETVCSVNNTQPIRSLNAVFNVQESSQGQGIITQSV
jgi:hypothetical protein